MQTLIRGDKHTDTHRDTQTARWSHTPTFIFSLFCIFWKNK
jgi:hypothetical protein